MSYCRFSSGDWHCDIYAYADASGGWTIHVAGNRVVGEAPVRSPAELPENYSSFTPEEFAEWSAKYVDRHNAVMKWVETAERVDIDLPSAGETYNLPTLEAFKAKLLDLRAEGFNFPDYALEMIDEETVERNVVMAEGGE